MEKYFRGIAQRARPAVEGLPRPWAGSDPDNDGEEFCLTVLALRLSAFANGVSRLHGEVSREMWQRDLARRSPLRRGAHHPHHQRRAPPHLDHARHRRPAGPVLRPRLHGASRPTSPSGTGSTGCPTRSCGAPTSGGASGWWPSPRMRLAQQLERRGVTNSELARGDERPVARTRSRSASPGGSPPTSGPTCCCRTRSGSLRLLTDNERPDPDDLRRARRTPTTSRARRSSRGSSTSRVTRAWPAASCSSRTTT